MSEKLSTDPYKGVRDFYPEDWAKLQSVFDTIRTTLKLYGYEEYNASPLEPAELYESKTSEEIVNEQTFTFTDRGDRRVTLRPEMTPTLARMVAGKRRELVFPVRWFSLPNLFRYERPQKGRLREHYQLNVDLLGIADSKADGEIIVMASKILEALGAGPGDFEIRINSRKLLNAAASALGYSDEESKNYLALLDRKAKMSEEEFEKARAPFQKDGTDALALIESGASQEANDAKQELDGLIAAFSARGMQNVIYDPSIVRGFDYYTGVVFEIYDTSPENTRSMFGGGRYDNLISLFGGDAIPAVGFGMGDVTLLDFLETHGISPKAVSSPMLYLGTPEEADIPLAHEFAETLRREGGIRVLVNVTGKSLSDQIKEAVKREIPYFIAYGKQEYDSGMVRLKDLGESSEKECSAAEVLDLLTHIA